MKKIIEYIGITTMICLSIIISEKTNIVVKEIDQIMIQIKENKEKQEIKPENAIIKNNTIIPGICGKTINIEKTYIEMKKIGKYNPQYNIYEEQKPELSIEKNYDKYIIKGNPKKNTIALILKIDEENTIDNIIKILKNKKVKVTFLIDNQQIKHNNQMIVNIIKEGHTIINTENQKQTTEQNKQILDYCYTETENEEKLKKCYFQQKHTIKPNIIITTNPIKEIKKKIESGSIITIPVNLLNDEQLNIVIDYIKSKGYRVEELQKHISEKDN